MVQVKRAQALVRLVPLFPVALALVGVERGLVDGLVLVVGEFALVGGLRNLAEGARLSPVHVLGVVHGQARRRHVARGGVVPVRQHVDQVREVDVAVVVGVDQLGGRGVVGRPDGLGRESEVGVRLDPGHLGGLVADLHVLPGVGV